MHTTQVIHIHPQAPPKPVEGAPCNGCGVCCLAQPCPLGMVLSGARSGACRALSWHDEGSRYRCGAIDEPLDVLARCLPRGLAWFGKPLAAVLPGLARRWIAAGSGCDSTLLPQPPAPLGDNPGSPSSLRPKAVRPHD